MLTLNGIKLREGVKNTRIYRGQGDKKKIYFFSLFSTNISLELVLDRDDKTEKWFLKKNSQKNRLF